MAKKERPLTVEIPRPADDTPAWSRVGIIAAIGFVVGVAWPRMAGVQIGPSVPGDTRTQAKPTAAPAAASAAAPGSAEPAAAGVATAEPGPKNEQIVLVGPGKITRCFDRKNKRVDDCGALQFDPVALPRLKELRTCPSALGLEGQLAIGFELNFEKKEVQVVTGKKKSSLPSSTVNGVLQCAAREFSSVALDEVPHKFRRYSLVYMATFHPPGWHPEDNGKEDDDEEGDDSAGTTTSESSVSGFAAVSWDTALVRTAPKTGKIAFRLVRGTRVKLIGRQIDWYKVEHRGKSGWVYRGALGL